MRTPERELIDDLFRKYLVGGPDPLADETKRRTIVAALVAADTDPRTVGLAEQSGRVCHLCGGGKWVR